MHDESVTLSATSSNISRRTIIKAGAWSVPVVALAVAAPMAAASGNPTPIEPGPNVWSGGVNVYENNWDVPNQVEINTNGDVVGFTRAGAAAGTIVIAGGNVHVHVTWTAATSVLPVVGDLNGWSVTGSLEPSVAGALTFTFPGEILNGVENAVLLPSMYIRPVSGNVLPSGSVNTELTGTYIQAKRAGTDFGA